MKEELPLFTAAYELNHGILDSVARCPRGLRPTLGDRLAQRALDLVEIVVRLRYSRERRGLFAEGNLVLEQLRILVRVSFEKRLISVGQYEGLAQSIDGIGRMMGGWRKSVDGKGSGDETGGRRAAYR